MVLGIPQYLYHKLRKHWLLTHPLSISDEEFLRCFRRRTLEEIPFKINAIFFINIEDKNNIVEMIKDLYPNSVCLTIEKAEKVCSHTFNLLGSENLCLGSKIDWHTDFKTGKKWPLAYHKEINLIDWKSKTHDEDFSDVKVPWELSRFQHLVTLGKAYWYTGNKKYIREFVAEVNDWVQNNPVEFGVNWATAMEAAIRAVNWIWAYHFFRDSEALTENFKITYLRNLLLHGRFIANNLERKSRSNHYLAGIVGLIYLGLFLRETKEGKQWLTQGMRALISEMEHQIQADGVDYEASTGYHRLVTEMFLSSYILLQKNNIFLPVSFGQKLEEMIDFVLHYTKPSGSAPLIGDSDDGRLQILAENETNDHRYLLSIGAVLFDRADFKAYSNGFSEEAFWLLGVEGLKKFDHIKTTNQKPESKAYKNGGFYIMRKDNYYMIIRCGDVGLNGKGAHGHCDALSFELAVGNRTFIIDPGTYVYTTSPKWRNLFRSTSYHNTIAVDEKEMNRFTHRDLFRMEDDAQAIVNCWISTDKFDSFDGEHRGYSRLKEPVIHRRLVLFNKLQKYWVMKDILYSNRPHRYDLFLHFCPMEISFKTEKTPIIETENKYQLNLLVVPVKTDGLKASILKGWISRSYGNKIRAPIVRYSKVGDAYAEFLTIFRVTKNATNEKGIINEALSFWNQTLLKK